MTHVEHLLRAAQDASQRTRNAMYALLVYLALVVTTLLNQLPFMSFIDQRYDLYRRARLLYQCNAFRRGQVPHLWAMQWSDTFLARARWHDGQGGFDEQQAAVSWARRCHLTGETVGELERAARWIIGNRLSSYDVDKFVDDARASLYGNGFQISVPLAGSKVDVNCIGILAAAGHLALLIWLFVALRQEILLIDRYCQFDRDGHAVLRYFSFFVSSTPAGSRRLHGLLTALVSALTWGPLVVTAILLVNDLYSTWAHVGDYFPSALIWFYNIIAMILVAASVILLLSITAHYRTIRDAVDRRYVPWLDWNTAERHVWLMNQMLHVHPDIVDAHHGCTIGDLLWLKHGVTVGDIQSHLDFIASKACVFLPAEQNNALVQAGLGWTIEGGMISGKFLRFRTREFDVDDRPLFLAVGGEHTDAVVRWIESALTCHRNIGPPLCPELFASTCVSIIDNRKVREAVQRVLAAKILYWVPPAKGATG